MQTSNYISVYYAKSYKTGNLFNFSFKNLFMVVAWILNFAGLAKCVNLNFTKSCCYWQLNWITLHKLYFGLYPQSDRSMEKKRKHDYIYMYICQYKALNMLVLMFSLVPLIQFYFQLIRLKTKWHQCIRKGIVVFLNYGLPVATFSS